MTALLARFLAPEDFGLVAGANIAITLIQMIAEGGVGAAVVQRAVLTPQFIGSALAVASMIAAACFLLTVGLSWPYEIFLGMDGLAAIVVALGISFFFIGPAGVCEGLMQRDMRFKDLFVVNLITMVVGYALPVTVLAAAGYGVWALVIGTLFRMASRLFLLWAGCRAQLSYRPERQALRDVAKFGVGITQDRIWNWLSVQTAPFMIGRFIGQAELGQFYLANQLAILPLQHMATVLSAVYLPVMSRAVGDCRRLTGIFVRLSGLTVVLVITLGLLMFIASDLIVRTVLGPKWMGLVPLFEILCLGAALRACVQMTDALSIARGNVYALANRRAAVTVLLVGMMFVAERFGVAGAAWAIVSSQVAMLVLTIGLARPGLDLSAPDVGLLGRQVLAAVVLIAVANLPLVYLHLVVNINDVLLAGLAVVVNGILLAGLQKFVIPDVMSIVLTFSGGGAKQGVRQ